MLSFRKLYLKIHPDLIQRYPKQALHNDENFQKLMEFLSAIREGHPKKERIKLEFYLRTDVEGEFQKAAVELRTTGGLCHNLVATQLAPFFEGTFIYDVHTIIAPSGKQI